MKGTAAFAVGAGGIVLALTVMPAPLRAQCAALPEATLTLAAPANVQAHLQSIALGEVSADHVQMHVALAMLADREATVDQISFSGLRVNGLPFYANPNSVLVHLTAGQEATLPAPLDLDLYYRDLDSLQPLIDLLRSGKAHIEGTMLLRADINLAQKLFLQRTHAQIDAPFQADLPLQFPGGLMMRAAAVSAASTANVLLNRVQTGITPMLASGSRRRQQLSNAFAPGLLRARARFSLDDGHGGTATFVCAGTGFMIAAGQFVLLKQTAQPWNFDPEIAAAIHQQHLKVVPGSYELHVWPTGSSVTDAAAGWSDTRQEMQLVRLAKDDDAGLMVPEGKGRPVRIQLGRAVSAGNLALYTLLGAAAQAAPPPLRLAPHNSPVSAGPDALATFRPLHDGPPEVLYLGAAAGEAGWLHLSVPVDATAFGAPLIDASGVTGIIQDEHTALPLAAMLRALGLPE